MKLKVTTHDLAGFDLSEIKHALTVEQKNELTLRLHKFASAKLVLNGSPNSVILHAVSVFRGEKGDKPQHVWNGTTLAFQNPDGLMGEAVDLKGIKGDKGDNGDGVTLSDLEVVRVALEGFNPAATYLNILQG